jgi:hypothetical protein
MIRSLSLRSRWAAASRRASADPAFARVERELPVVDRERPPVARVRVLPLARLLLALARLLPADLRVPPEPERLDFVLLARVLREPLLELDLLDPPLLACGMASLPWTDLAIACTLSRDGPPMRAAILRTGRIWVSS